MKLVFTAMLLVSAAALAQPAVLEPEQAAEAFYRWYLAQVTQSREPLLDDRAKLRTYVAAPTVASIVRRMNSADGLDTDYFLQAQDIQDSWKGQVKAERISKTQLVAETFVTLGEGQTHHVLNVQLRKEKGVWKISRVRHSSTGSPDGKR